MTSSPDEPETVARTAVVAYLLLASFLPLAAWNGVRNWPVVLGVFVALLLESQLGRLGWIRAFFLVPMVVTPVVVGIQWRFLLNAQFGVLSWVLEALHLPGGTWLTEPAGAMFWIIAVPAYYFGARRHTKQDFPREPVTWGSWASIIFFALFGGVLLAVGLAK